MDDFSEIFIYKLLHAGMVDKAEGRAYFGAVFYNFLASACGGIVVDIYYGVSMIIIFFPDFSSAYFIASRQIGVVLTGPITASMPYSR